MHPNVVESEEQLAEIVRGAKTVVVLGAKDETDPEAAAFTIPQSVQARGLRVIPVNPKLQRALGETAYPSLGAVPDRADILDVFRRSDAIGAIADEVLALPTDRRPAVFWMQTGIRNDEAAEKLAQAGIRVVQDRCLSVYTSKYLPRR
jgi:predicted CoA-binding protein